MDNTKAERTTTPCGCKGRKSLHLVSLIIIFVILVSLTLVMRGSLCGVGLDKEGKAAPAPQEQTESDGTLVINTTALCAGVAGYGGPVPVEVYVTGNRIDSVSVLPNSESPEFFASLGDEGLLGYYNGKTLDEALASRPDAVSGATFSSKGFNAAVGNAFVAYGELAGIAIEAPTEEKVYPEAELIAEMLGEGYTELETAPEGTDSAYQSELGYAFNVHAAGFSGDLHILVAIDNNGAIIASKLYQHTETPNEYEGIDGSKLAKSSYSKKWIGVTAETPDSELPMESKATYTSNGYKEAVKLAFAAFETVKGA